MSLVTFRRLERLGRLGNQLWEIASTLGIAARLGAEVRLPTWSYSRYFSVPHTVWADQVPVEAVDAESTRYVAHIADRHRSYMQDRSLWSNVEDTVFKWFEGSQLADDVICEKHAAFYDVPPADRIAVHIRRGDAVHVPLLFPVQSPLYVKAALETLGEGQVFIFTDDPGWCFDHLGFTGGKVMVGNADWEDLMLMAACPRIAIANSSFSYWGATLGGSPHRLHYGQHRVCYPQTWYGRQFHDLDYRLMIPPEWTAIPDPKAGTP